MDYTKLTLGQLLGSEDATIKRNAMSILKVCQKCDHQSENGRCIYCFAPSRSLTAECPNCGSMDFEKNIKYLGDQKYSCSHCK